MSSDAVNAQEQLEVDYIQTRRPPAGELVGSAGVQAGFASPAERLASSVGNRNFSNVVARMSDGEGLMAGGPRASRRRGGDRVVPRPRAVSAQRPARDPVELVRRLPVRRQRPHRAAGRLTRPLGRRRARSPSAATSSSPEGQYNPGSSSGQDLIAHEVAHVVQQRGAPSSGPLTVTTPGDALEREAESAARDAFD